MKSESGLCEEPNDLIIVLWFHSRQDEITKQLFCGQQKNIYNNKIYTHSLYNVLHNNGM